MLKHVDIKYDDPTKTADLLSICSLILKVFIPYNPNSQ